MMPRYPTGTLVKLFPDGVVTGVVANVMTDEPPRYYETLNNAVQHDYYIVPDDGRKSFWNHYGKYVTHWQPLPEPPQE